VNFSAFDPINIKSKKVRNFYVLLAVWAVCYSIGYVFYLSRTATERAMAFEMMNESMNLAGLAVMLSLFLITLRWQILRTAILGVSLLSLAFLYCGLLLLIFDNSVAHAAGLILLCLLFTAVFWFHSNIPIYLKDGTYGDAWLESPLVALFVIGIARMLMKVFQNT
jgi:hypothetical protein